jgi:hypothetical protein
MKRTNFHRTIHCGGEKSGGWMSVEQLMGEVEGQWWRC